MKHQLQELAMQHPDSPSTLVQTTSARPRPGIAHNSTVPPVSIPPGHIGPVVIPGTGRLVWWTGRVAIGLRHQPERHFEQIGQSSLWIQNLMLRGMGKARPA
jgi:hypothetical protein